MFRTHAPVRRSAAVRRTAPLFAVLGLMLTAAPSAGALEARPAADAAVTVQLTVTGATGKVFDSSVSTTGHEVTTASGGTHKCDGTNNGANPSPGATPTAALDDAAKKGDFTWDGTWNASFEDYFVTTIADGTGGADAYWNISVNGTPTPVGGCQFLVKAGDKVAFTWTEL